MRNFDLTIEIITYDPRWICKESTMLADKEIQRHGNCGGQQFRF
jgi:hypothetical protein